MNANRKSEKRNPLIPDAASISSTLETGDWEASRSRVKSSVSHSAAHCFPEFANLLFSLANRYCDQQPPASAEETAARWSEEAVVNEIQTGIVSLDLAAHRSHRIRHSLFDLAKTLSGIDFPRNDQDIAAVRSRLTAVVIAATSLRADELSLLGRPGSA